MQDTETVEILEQIDLLGKEFKAATGADGKINKDLTEINARLTDIEQKLARRGGGGSAPVEMKSWGQMLIESQEFKTLAGSSSQRGKASVQVETKAITVTSAVGVGGALTTPDYRQDVTMLPQRRPTVRALLAPGQTNSNVVFFPRQTVRTNAAAPVAEGTLKPQSDIQFEQVQSPVTTIASWILASRQLLDDAPALMSTVDGELRYMLAFDEEVQLLLGDGTGANLLGLIPQATAFAAPFTGVSGDTGADTIIQAIAQSELALLPASGIVLNFLDWYKMLALKDGVGRYLSAGPFGPANPRLLWDLPVAPTLAIPVSHFLAGNFNVAAQIFDRLDAEVLVSTEDSDNFRKNLITIRGEKRLALAVKPPQALIYGTLP
jgi:HK97 family phage major capsid protein